ncbi:MAG: hypothetical protein GY940_11815, partial [bacterium]|nr:hypothetical protein [bacterium]
AWTGNIRELESNVKRLITYYPDFESQLEAGDGQPLEPGLVPARDWLESKMIRTALIENNWNKVDAAKDLGISRQYLFTLMKKRGIDATQN